MTSLQLHEEFIITKRSLDQIENMLGKAFSLARGEKIKSVIAAVAEVASDASNTSLVALQKFENKTELRRANVLSDMEASWTAINLCLFLFEQIDNIPVDDVGYESTVHSFASIGKQIAGAADEAARLALNSFRKESGHD